MNQKKLLMYNIYLFELLLFLIAFSSCSDISTNKIFLKDSTDITHKAAASNAYTYVIFNADQNSYGYNILEHNRILIHQRNVPGQPGNKGFSTKEDAEKVAQLVLSKLNNKIMPPSINRKELDSLNINFYQQKNNAK